MVVGPPVHQVPDIHQHLHGSVLQLLLPYAKCFIVDWAKIWECVLKILPDMIQTGESEEDGRGVAHVDDEVIVFVFPVLRERVHGGDI